MPAFKEENGGKYVLITGASAGIGAALAREFAKQGRNLILVARREERLKNLADELLGKSVANTRIIKTPVAKPMVMNTSTSPQKIQVHVIPGDLSLPDTARKIFEHTQNQGWEVETLVNNAGFGGAGDFARSDLSRQLEMLQVNNLALVSLTHLYLQEMLRHKGGSILNVGSTAGFQPGPYMAVYYASKAFVNSFTEALHEELKNSNIAVSCLCPGATDTEFQEAANMQRSALFQSVMMPADKVAGAGVRGLKKRRVTVLPGVMYYMAIFIQRLLPRSWVRRRMGAVNRGRLLN